jgi:DNA polymerase III delta subunit
VSAPLAFWWGDDAYALDAAVETFRARADLFPTGAPERWRVRGEVGAAGRVLAELQERIATPSMFGGGVLAVVSDVAPLVRRGEDRDALIALLGLVAPGNGVAFTEETDSGRKDPPARPLADAVRAAGGEVREFQAPRAGQLTGWIEARARERGLVLGPGAAKELALRLGGLIREGDVDRRYQSRLAAMELGKLALLRVDGAPVSEADVQALAAEAVPSSMWAFVDAVASRNLAAAVDLGDRIGEATPEPVILATLHRRIRELIEIADRLAEGESPGSLVRSMRLNPYRAEVLVRQAAAWSLPELEAALEGLLELDAIVKGVPGAAGGEAQWRLAFLRWIIERVGRQR